MWEPLPSIIYGYAVHPLSPSHRDTRISHRPRLSTVTEASTTESFIHRDVVALEVGDEVYAFEKYIPRGKETEGIWYRGYVVCTTRRPPVSWNAPSDPSSSRGPRLEEPQQFQNGIRRGADSSTKPPRTPGFRGEDEEEDLMAMRKSFKLAPLLIKRIRRGRPYRLPRSVRSLSPTESHNMKPLPPRPSLKSNDETKSGSGQPIVDEIASALREWHMLMFQYLARREYQLFQTVREHIEALHSGRRQLLAQTLSDEETANLRRDCVARLVSGNIVQNLDVIVRHPVGGGLVTVDVEGEIDTRNWMSAVRIYALQASLAFADVSGDGSKALRSRHSLDLFSTSPLPTPAHSAFPELFFHVFLELRAFVATPCAPGETAELYFSLYNKSDARFVTEDFYVVLNHNGVLARDPSARIRTLFTDLAPSDIQGTIFLVCKIIRNGSVKIGPNPSSGIPQDHGYRGSQASGWNSSSLDIASGTHLLNMSDGGAAFRRPFGCAVLELSQLSKVATDSAEVSSTKEHSMPIFTPVNEATFSMLHQDIINSNSKEFEKSPRAEMIAVSVKVFHGNAQTIVKENTFPGEDRNELYIKLWSGEFPSSNNNAARRSVSPFVRGSGSFTTSNIQVTIEVRDTTGKIVENVISQGSSEPNVSQFHSLVFLRNNQPTFGELIKLTLPWVELPPWHLFLTFRYRSSRDKSVKILSGETGDKPFAFAFLPLFPDGRAFLEDGSHTLVLFRADRLNLMTPDMYLAATPWLLPGQRQEHLTIPTELQRIAPPIRDVLVIRSSLCSTRHTQNPVLSRLLNWTEIVEKDLLSAVLVKFTFVGEIEIVKFLRDIFGSLFAILASPMNSTGDLDHLVFNALVTVLGIVQDRRFSNFQPVLDIYIQQHFNYAAASSHMINSMNRMLADPTGNDTASPLRAAIKVWHYIFKFIVKSRALQRAREAGVGGGATAEHLESSFMRELRAHLSEVNKMMKTTSPSLIGTQTLALQRFTSILPELAQIFPTVEVVSIATAFANTMSSAKGKLAVFKLIMFLQLVKGFLFDNAQSRSLLVEAVVIWIKPHFGRFDEYAQTQKGDDDAAIDAARVSWLEGTRICVTIIAVMLDKLQQRLVDPDILADRNAFRQEQDNVDYLLSLMPRLLESYRELQDDANVHAVERKRTPATSPSTALVTFPESYPFSLIAQLPRIPKGFNGVYQTDGQILFSPVQGETGIVLLVILLSSPKKYLLNFFEGVFEIEGRDNFATLLLQLFKVATSILDNEAWPSNWLNVNIMAHKVLVKMMDAVAVLLERRFIPTDDATFQFNTQLWMEAIQVLLKLLSSDQLVIEEFSPQRRRAVWRMAGDIRGEGAAILQQLWDALGWPEDRYQTSLSPLVSHVVNLCVSHHDLLRSTAVRILYSMIVSQYQEHQHFDDIEHELISKLDSLFMTDSKADDLSRPSLSAISAFRLREKVSSFLDSVDLFLEMLLRDEFSDDRVIATLRLMNFIRRIGRNEIYIKYVHQLVDMHLQSQNYVEAALTLKLHADLHEWDLNSFVEPMDDLGLPQQSQFHRKETLHLLILDYLGKGKAWESAIEICKELAYQHSEVTFNYGRLAEIMRHQAALLEHIITNQRYYPDYFRVAFYGNFPVAIRNKQFIYRGFEWEKFGAFCERMLAKHSGAQLLRTLGDPPVDIRFGSDQYIQCSTVTPEPNRELPIFTNPDVSPAVRTYYERCAINYFSSLRSVPKVDREGNEEAWVEKTFFTTEESFPAVLRRSEVVSVELVEMSPIENALLEVELKNKELTALRIKYSNVAKAAQVFSTNTMSMALNGVVDAPAGSGISSYRIPFLMPGYVTRYPDRGESVEKLRAAVDEQVRIIDSCLQLHHQMCPPEMLGFHKTLEGFFHKNYHEEIQRLSFEIPAERWPNHSYTSSLTDATSIVPSSSSASTTRAPFSIPPLQLPGSQITPPQSPLATFVSTASQPSRLQKHIAHLARHGMNAVASGPGEGVVDTGIPRSDSLSVSSPQGSIVNVTGAVEPPQANSGASIMGSISGSFKKGRFSRLGALSFSRRDG
ncbi:C2 domain in Dock180 and Zizimin proteins-domain-containing protein [Lactarius quietus]|nr:C2 domain in Dock180 and Zizimin proteins-domain-containing protein [Lactarius quietus]